MSGHCKPLRFSMADFQRCSDEWGANCGPGALAAVADLTLDEVHPYLLDFDQKHYTNPMMMFDALHDLGIKFTRSPFGWPLYGLVRIQWEGPWTAPCAPPRVRLRHSHWVGAQSLDDQCWIFDINAMNVGGWIPAEIWENKLVPWLLREIEPDASGAWHRTHILSIQP